jgi:hypothetical protein
MDKMVEHKSTCDLQHRIHLKSQSHSECEFMCCDSRQCLFKVEIADRCFCKFGKQEKPKK